MNVICVESLISRDDHELSNSGATNNTAVLGYAALDVVRNYCGADDTTGNEVVMASKLGGHVCVWVRLDPVLKEKGVVVAEDIGRESSSTIEQCRKPYAEFKVPAATGTTLAIRPPLLGNYYSKKETDILVALGCANGSVIICKSGILASRPGDNGITRSASSSGGGGGAVVGDSGGDDTVVMNFTSFHNTEDGNSVPPGEIIATVGGGHACVMSLAWHPTIPNTFVVGRKDGIVDIYSAHTTSDDYYYGYEGLNFRRVHRLVHSSFPIRALSYSMPEGELLFAGDDDGKLYSYDTSMALSETSESFKVASPVKLVACALAAHKGWIMNLCAFPDGNRVATCGSDKSVRVWDCGMGLASGTPVHSFDGANEGWVWGVDCSSGAAGSARLKMVSCGNDGSMQVFSCSE